MNQRGAGELGTVEIGRQRNDENGLKNSGQSVALPDHDWPSSRLFPWSVSSEVGPPDLTALHLRSS
jgi:hypothetical protein